MGVGQKITDALLFQIFIHARVIAALGKPNANRTAAEHFFIKFRRGLDLTPDSPFITADQGKKSVGRGAGDDDAEG